MEQKSMGNKIYIDPLLDRHDFDLSDDLSIGPDLEQEFAQQASKYASWGLMKAQADAEVRRLEEAEELLFSQLYAKFRKNNKGDNSLKENDAKAFIRRHPKYRQAQAETRAARKSADIMKVAVRSMEMRSQMLQQMGPLFRQERGMMQVPAHLSGQDTRPKQRRQQKQAQKQHRQSRVDRASAALKKKRSTPQ